MAINKPILDDRVYKDLIDEMRSLIPRYNHAYTNFNPSDPGITLLELFAWLADQLLYRLNRIPEPSYRAMLKIILGDQYLPEDSLANNVKNARLLLEEVYRAVTEEDYITLVKAKMEEMQPGLSGRVIVMNNLDLSYIPDTVETLDKLKKTGHITIILIPRCGDPASEYCDPLFLPANVPSEELKNEIYLFLKERRLISTTIHVVSPSYYPVDLDIRMELVSNSDVLKVVESAKERVKAYFDPITGGSEGAGWAPGRSFHTSELFQLLEGTVGVDHVEKTMVRSNGKVINDNGQEYPDNSKLKEWELISLGNINIDIISN